MTKAELIKALEPFPDDMMVLFETSDDWGSYGEIFEVNAKETVRLGREEIEYFPVVWAHGEEQASVVKVILLE